MKKFYLPFSQALRGVLFIAAVLVALSANAQQVVIPSALPGDGSGVSAAWTLNSDDNTVSLTVQSDKASVATSSKKFISTLYKDETTTTHMRTLDNVYKFGATVTGSTTRYMTVTVPSRGYLAIYGRDASAGTSYILTAVDSEGGTSSLTHDDATIEISGNSIYFGETFGVRAGKVTITSSASFNLAGIEFIADATAPVATATKIWNFGSIYASSSFTPSEKTEESGTFDAISVDGYMYAIANNKAAVDGSTKSWSIGSMTKRFKTGGTGDVASEKVKGNGLLFKVSEGSTITICAMASSSTATRKMVLKNINGTDIGTALIGGANPSATTEPTSFTYSGTEPAILYLYAAPAVDGDDTYTAGGLNVFYVSATNAVALTQAEVDALVYVPTAINSVSATSAKANNGVVKTADYIIKDGKKYNYAGQQMK